MIKSRKYPPVTEKQIKSAYSGMLLFYKLKLSKYAFLNFVNFQKSASFSADFGLTNLKK